jgi:hypothetical protein
MPGLINPYDEVPVTKADRKSSRPAWIYRKSMSC